MLEFCNFWTKASFKGKTFENFKRDISAIVGDDVVVSGTVEERARASRNAFFRTVALVWEFANVERLILYRNASG